MVYGTVQGLSWYTRRQSGHMQRQSEWLMQESRCKLHCNWHTYAGLLLSSRA